MTIVRISECQLLEGSGSVKSIWFVWFVWFVGDQLSVTRSPIELSGDSLKATDEKTFHLILLVEYFMTLSGTI